MKHSLLVAWTIVFLVACSGPEPPPPPIPMVELDCHCEGTIESINGDSTFLYNEDCQYYYTKIVNTGTPSEAQYHSQIKNDAASQEGWTVQMRTLYWMDDGSNNPNVTAWQAFFNDNTHPDYASSEIEDGLVIKYLDIHGRTWTSDTASVCVKDAVFQSFEYDSDTTGEYMKFVGVFSGTLFNSDISPDSSRCFSNVQIMSAFQRY